MKIKVWDLVQAIASSAKWRQWKVLKIFSKVNKLLVEWFNLKTKYTKKTTQQAWSMIKKEFPLDASNVSVICPSKNKPTRVWYEFNKTWKKVRISKLSWEKLDSNFKKS